MAKEINSVESDKSDRIVVAFDCSGGENSPHAILKAANDFSISKEGKDVYFLLFSFNDAVCDVINNYSALKAVSEIIVCNSYVSDDCKPLSALRNSESTMYKAVMSVKSGEADCIISSGNTAALLLIAKFLLGTIENISKPAIISEWPSLGQQKRVSMIDNGANVECSSRDLVMFAVMGSVYCRCVLGREAPIVKLLNVGVEQSKGNEIIKGANALFLSSNFHSINFCGYIEPDKIFFSEDLDLVVSDGFSGNICLKASEGAVKFVFHFAKKKAQRTFIYKILLFLCALIFKKNFFKEIDPTSYNGALMIGIDGIVVKSHGSSDERGQFNAISSSVSFVRSRINSKLREGILEVRSDLFDLN